MLKGNNFHHHTTGGLALKPQTINGATVDGEDILVPQFYGRQVSFRLLAGAFAAVAQLVVKIEEEDSAGTLTFVQDKNGADLQFTATKTVDGGELENGSLLGTVDCSFLALDTKIIRLKVQETASQNALVAASYEISDLYKVPSGQDDDLFDKLFPPA